MHDPQHEEPATTTVSARSPGSPARGAGPRSAPPTRSRPAPAPPATSLSRSQSVSTILRNAPEWLFARSGVLVVRVRLVPHVGEAERQRGHHVDAPPRSRPPPPRRARRCRSGRCDSSTISPAITTAGTDSALIDTAPPAASPIHTAVRRRGSSR